MQRRHNKKFTAVMLVLVVALSGFTGCTKNPAGSEITSSVQNGTGTETTSLSAKDMTVEEILKHIKLYGEEVSLPCKVSELPKTVTLGNGYTLSEGGAVCDVLHNEKVIGSAHFDMMKSNEFKEINMSSGYDDEMIYSFTFDAITKGVDCFDVVGVTTQDTEESVKEKLGKPIYESDGHIQYKNVNGEIQYSIGFFFDDEGKMSLLVVYVSKEPNEKETTK